MTQRLYYEDQYIKEFNACVISCEKNQAGFDVVLDRTAFFPEGGGQPGDTGNIGSAVVLDTRESNGEIIHITDKEVSGDVFCRIDFDRRFIHMQQHSGEHIFSGCLHNMLGWDNVGFHMGENEVTVDFNGPVTDKQLAEIELETNRYIYANIPVEIILPSSDELSEYNYRSKKEIQGQVRLCRIGKADLCACCGTHVSRTGEIGIVKATGMMNYKGGVRISLQIGLKAFMDYSNKHNEVTKLQGILCAKPDAVAEATEKLKEKMAEEHYKLTGLKKELFELKCGTMSGDKGIIFESEGVPDDARMMADIMKNYVRLAAVFIGNDLSGYKYALCSKDCDVNLFAKKMNAVLNGRGGGKDGLVMGSVNSSENDILKFIEAEELL